MQNKLEKTPASQIRTLAEATIHSIENEYTNRWLKSTCPSRVEMLESLNAALNSNSTDEYFYSRELFLTFKEIVDQFGWNNNIIGFFGEDGSFMYRACYKFIKEALPIIENLNNQAIDTAFFNDEDVLFSCLISKEQLTRYNWTFLNRACSKGLDRIAPLLLGNIDEPRKPCELEALGSEFEILLNNAASNGHAGIVQLLLNDKRLYYNQGKSLPNILTEACIAGHYKVVDQFLNCTNISFKNSRLIIDNKDISLKVSYPLKELINFYEKKLWEVSQIQYSVLPKELINIIFLNLMLVSDDKIFSIINRQGILDVSSNQDLDTCAIDIIDSQRSFSR